MKNDIENDNQRSSKAAPSFLQYCQFFEDKLQPLKKDIVTGELWTKKNGSWEYAESKLEYLSSIAIESKKFRKTHLKDHLARYKEQSPGELLIDIPEWDGQDRLKLFANALHVKNLEQSMVYDLICDWGAKMIGRAYCPTYQNRMLILKGDQGIGKDTWLMHLLSGLDSYYMDICLSQNERDLFHTVSHLLVARISEFDRTERMSVSILKNLITSDHVFLRTVYQRSPSKRNLRVSFVSSVNVDCIFRDHTGNRRFIVFEVDKIDWSYPKDQSQQIIAQFFYLYKNNFKSSQETENALKTYLINNTPEDIEKVFLDIYDKRMDLYLSDRKLQVADRESAFELIVEIAKKLQIKPVSCNRILKASNRAVRRNTGWVFFGSKYPERGAESE